MPELYLGRNSPYSGPGRTLNAPKSATLAENPPHLSVLLVDDEALIRWSLRKGLTKRGHEVVEAESAAAALESIGGDPDRFGAVVLDYRLPDRQDLSLLTDIRRLMPKAIVVMMTAYGDADMQAGAMQLGARAVIEKPFQVNQLISLLESPAVN
jgi:DNA-binding NtrC family response regulator